jgi:hypothetical protein
MSAPSTRSRAQLLQLVVWFIFNLRNNKIRFDNAINIV